jgi:hypothetical protein
LLRSFKPSTLEGLRVAGVGVEDVTIALLRRFQQRSRHHRPG